MKIAILQIRFLVLLIVFPAGLFSIPSAWPCRFNVRDVGFVEYGPAPYHFYGFIGSGVSPDRKTEFQQIAQAALLDSGIDLEFIEVALDKTHPALAYLPSSLPDGSQAAVLVSQDGRSLPIPLGENGRPDKETLWNALETLTTSPLREILAVDVIEAYGAIVIVEGESEEENRRVRQVAEEIIERVDNQLATLPKAVERPPVLRIVKRSDFERERILLWSLGMESGDPRTHAAVIYGRLRRIGPRLTEGEIARESLSSLVSAIGLSCECGLDREWMMGTLIPFRWTNKHDRDMALRLGFDPNSPLIKTEISQILSNSFAARRNATGGDGMGGGLMGYGEFVVEEEITEGESAMGESTATSSIPSITDWIAMSRSDIFTASPAVNNVTPDRWVAQEVQKESPVWQKYKAAFLLAGGLALLSLFGGFYLLWERRRRE